MRLAAQFVLGRGFAVINPVLHGCERAQISEARFQIFVRHVAINNPGHGKTQLSASNAAITSTVIPALRFQRPAILSPFGIKRLIVSESARGDFYYSRIGLSSAKTTTRMTFAGAASGSHTNGYSIREAMNYNQQALLIITSFDQGCISRLLAKLRVTVVVPPSIGDEDQNNLQ